jgi:hypothetical protein
MWGQSRVWGKIQLPAEHAIIDMSNPCFLVSGIKCMKLGSTSTYVFIGDLILVTLSDWSSYGSFIREQYFNLFAHSRQMYFNYATPADKIYTIQSRRPTTPTLSERAIYSQEVDLVTIQ